MLENLTFGLSKEETRRGVSGEGNKYKLIDFFGFKGMQWVISHLFGLCILSFHPVF